MAPSATNPRILIFLPSGTRCVGCSIPLLTNRQLEEHACEENTDSSSPYFFCSCNICGEKLLERSMLKSHLDAHLKEKFSCRECGESFILQGNLTAHLRLHDKSDRFQCGKCWKSFSKKSSLTIHYRIHTGERPYNCKKCGKKFTSNAILNNHMKTHTGMIRRYHFDETGRSSPANENWELVTDVQAASLADSPVTVKKNMDGKFVCDECGNSFNHKKSLTLHTRTIHSGERPYECTDCGKRYSDSRCLKVHLLSHSSEPCPYRCEKCGNSFSRKSSLNRHLRIHLKTVS